MARGARGHGVLGRETPGCGGLEMEMYKLCKWYSIRTNNIARRVLGFKTPNEMVEKFFNKVV